MDVIFSDTHHQHDLEIEMLTEGPVPCFERAARVDNVIQAIDARRFGNLRPPTSHGLEPLGRIHNQDYLSFLATAWDDWHARTQNWIQPDFTVFQAATQRQECRSISLLGSATTHLI